MTDHYVRALKFAESREEFSLEELVKELGLTELQEKQFAHQINDGDLFNHCNASSYFNGYKGNNIKLHLSVEDKFRLLNYEALEEARTSSKSATRFAIAALAISIAASVVSSILSIWQINSEVAIPSKLVKKVDGILKNQEVSNKYLSEIRRSIYENKNAAVNGSHK